MTTLVYTNKLTWFQNDGEPLKSGYIYVGEVRQDPRAFPKTVTFTDSDGNSFTAAQPLRTDENGRIQYNGVAITAEVDGDFSLLILDSSQVQIDDGYVASVKDANGGATGDIANYRQYALTLADMKQLNKIPGQTVGSVGKVITTDNLGADWLVVSNTGNPADDIDLIDFDNGAQGQRIKNFTGEAQTAQDKLDVRTNIDVYSTTEADNLLATKQDATPAVANYNLSASQYVRDNLSSALNVTTAATISTTTTVGPTGSGATIIWTALDELPADCKYLDLHVDVNLNDLSAQSSLEYAITFSGGFKCRERLDATTVLFRLEREEFGRAQLSTGNIFTVNWSGSGGISTREIIIRIAGFGL